jgi:site-specific recombinase XerD
VNRSLRWCGQRSLHIESTVSSTLKIIEPITVAAYIETLQRQAAPPTVKQHMAAIRMMFSWFTEKGVLAMNPAREVKTERFSRTEGKTLAFVDGEVQTLLNAVETSTRTGLRDRALLGTLAYTFARIGAVVNLKVEDYYPSGKRFLLRFKEKGVKEKELPVASLPGGAHVVFDYSNPPALGPDQDEYAAARETLAARVAAVGEAFREPF